MNFAPNGLRQLDILGIEIDISGKTAEAMTILVRAATLTNFESVASACGLDARALLAEVGLPGRCLAWPGDSTPAGGGGNAAWGPSADRKFIASPSSSANSITGAP